MMNNQYQLVDRTSSTIVVSSTFGRPNRHWVVSRVDGVDTVVGPNGRVLDTTKLSTNLVDYIEYVFATDYALD